MDYDISKGIVPMEIVQEAINEYTRLYGDCSELINKRGGYILIDFERDFSYTNDRTGLTGMVPSDYKGELMGCLGRHRGDK